MIEWRSAVKAWSCGSILQNGNGVYCKNIVAFSGIDHVLIYVTVR
jgi:hypothetical protein